MKRLAAIFDIDGTLADVTHRLHLIDHSNYPADLHTRKDWVEFKRRAADDPPVPNIVELARTLHTAGYAIVCCTGRDDGMHSMTCAWLKQWGIPYDDLYMRAYDDRRDDTVVKRDLLDKIRLKYQPWIVIEDRVRVVAMWREAGLTCLQCAPGNY